MFDNLATSFNKRKMQFKSEWSPPVQLMPQVLHDPPQSLQDSMKHDNRSSMLLREMVAEFIAQRQKEGPIISRNYDYMPTRPFSVPVSPDGREFDYSNTVNLKEAIQLSPFINGNPKYKTFNKLLSGQIQK